MLFNAGVPSTKTVTAPGAQGAVITGVQGWGVRTPNAAEVADATAGFAKDKHIPKGIFGVSVILAVGLFMDKVFVAVPVKVEGATPKLQVQTADVVQICAIKNHPSD